jgi:exportin-2 (importin alpha re-exporter)
MRSNTGKASFDRRRPQTKQPRQGSGSPAPGQHLHVQNPRTDSIVTAAENSLKEEAKKPNYSLSLLTIVSTAAQPLKTRLAAALAFKNFIRHNYVVRSTTLQLLEDARI